VLRDHAKAAVIWKSTDNVWWRGPDDPNVCVLRVTPITAELWDGPASKYSCSGSPDMLVNGKTAIDAAATFGSGLANGGGRRAGMPFPHTDRTVDVFDADLAAILEAKSIRLPTISLTIDETQIPPGSASGSKRARH
jgi:hypothetical protein